MKALTIKQPWASLIVKGVKDIENRSWRTHYRGRILVHAGASKSFSSLDTSLYLNYQQFSSLSDDKRHFLNYGIWQMSAIIGEVDIVGCRVDSKSIWAEEQHEHRPTVYHWILANPVEYDKPILNVKGGQSFWNYNL